MQYSIKNSVIWTAICSIKVDNLTNLDFRADFNKFLIFSLAEEMTILHPKLSNIYIMRGPA